MNTGATPSYAGLRIDVDTFRGTRDGVPELLRVLEKYGIQGSFFFSVGPDNMGRHLWRLIRPDFLKKMLRSKAPNLYGWDILMRGTLWPGTVIGDRLGPVIRDTARAGHEVGIHAWDHHAWQMRSDDMSKEDRSRHIRLGIRKLEEILGAPVRCSAAAGWKCTEATLSDKEAYGMTYHSDCRGETIFRPLVDGKPMTPQIPATLPTYDEMVGRDGVTDKNFNQTMLDMIKDGRLNVLTVHAEVEGIAKKELFDQFLASARDNGIQFVPMGHLLPPLEQIPEAKIVQGKVAGREGVFCLQGTI
ncbi:MAG: 4-deoxy-4-formamido-L-arabinose-phosphoundecaprenol deformylase [Gammaproteobacteria bacterium]|nr:4-deoxy-4-formamido-L-arabinose-phosphoundecaprenol deformylase [Gammaproteobacteria bacterium]